jgi:hypothetical protein
VLKPTISCFPPLGRVEHRWRLAGVHGHRLLDEHVMAGLQGVDRVLARAARWACRR